MATITNWRDHLPADHAGELFDLDADWQDECTPEHLCEECVAADADEQRVLERLARYCSIPAARPWREGEPERAA